MLAPIYNCATCDKPLYRGDKLWQVMLIDRQGKLIFVPCCSSDCAETIKKENAKMHEARAFNVSNQTFQIIDL